MKAAVAALPWVALALGTLIAGFGPAMIVVGTLFGLLGFPLAVLLIARGRKP